MFSIFSYLGEESRRKAPEPFSPEAMDNKWGEVLAAIKTVPLTPEGADPIEAPFGKATAHSITSGIVVVQSNLISYKMRSDLERDKNNILRAYFGIPKGEVSSEVGVDPNAANDTTDTSAAGDGSNSQAQISPMWVIDDKRLIDALGFDKFVCDPPKNKTGCISDADRTVMLDAIRKYIISNCDSSPDVATCMSNALQTKSSLLSKAFSVAAAGRNLLIVGNNNVYRKLSPSEAIEALETASKIKKLATPGHVITDEEKKWLDQHFRVLRRRTDASPARIEVLLGNTSRVLGSVGELEELIPLLLDNNYAVTVVDPPPSHSRFGIVAERVDAKLIALLNKAKRNNGVIDKEDLDLIVGMVERFHRLVGDRINDIMDNALVVDRFGALKDIIAQHSYFSKEGGDKPDRDKIKKYLFNRLNAIYETYGGIIPDICSNIGGKSLKPDNLNLYINKEKIKAIMDSTIKDSMTQISIGDYLKLVPSKYKKAVEKEINDAVCAEHPSECNLGGKAGLNFSLTLSKLSLKQMKARFSENKGIKVGSASEANLFGVDKAGKATNSGKNKWKKLTEKAARLISNTFNKKGKIKSSEGNEIKPMDSAIETIRDVCPKMAKRIEDCSTDNCKVAEIDKIEDMVVLAEIVKNQGSLSSALATLIGEESGLMESVHSLTDEVSVTYNRSETYQKMSTELSKFEGRSDDNFNVSIDLDNFGNPTLTVLCNKLTVNLTGEEEVPVKIRLIIGREDDGSRSTFAYFDNTAIMLGRYRDENKERDAENLKKMQALFRGDSKQ